MDTISSADTLLFIVMSQSVKRVIIGPIHVPFIAHVHI